MSKRGFATQQSPGFCLAVPEICQTHGQGKQLDSSLASCKPAVVCKPQITMSKLRHPVLARVRAFLSELEPYSVTSKDSWTVYASTNTLGHIQYTPNLQAGMVIVKPLTEKKLHLTNTSVHKLATPQSLFFRQGNYRSLHQKGLTDSQYSRQKCILPPCE